MFILGDPFLDWSLATQGHALENKLPLVVRHRTNGDELGDPKCVWTQGATPARVVNITHPGFRGPSTSAF